MNTITIACNELKRIFRDKRLIFIMISQPFIIAAIVGLMTYHRPENIKVNVVNRQNNIYTEKFIDQLKQNPKFEISETENYQINDIKSGKYRVSIIVNISETGGEIKVISDPTSGIVESTVLSEVNQSVANISIGIAESGIQKTVDAATLESNNLQLQKLTASRIIITKESIQPIKIESEEATPFRLKFFDYYGSSMMVLLVFLVVLNLAGVSITSERANGTFERLSVTPYKKTDIILGKAIAHFLVGLLIIILGYITLSLLFHIAFGNLYLLSLLSLIIVATAVTLGLLISSITTTVVESVELAMYMFFISFLTSGMAVPIETAHKSFAILYKALPFYYAVDASRRINMLDANWSQISGDIFILIGFFIGFLILSILLLRREAK